MLLVMLVSSDSPFMESFQRHLFKICSEPKGVLLDAVGFSHSTSSWVVTSIMGGTGVFRYWCAILITLPYWSGKMMFAANCSSSMSGNKSSFSSGMVVVLPVRCIKYCFLRRLRHRF